MGVRIVISVHASRNFEEIWHRLATFFFLLLSPLRVQGLCSMRWLGGAMCLRRRVAAQHEGPSSLHSKHHRGQAATPAFRCLDDEPHQVNSIVLVYRYSVGE